MQNSDIPSKSPVVFAQSATGAYIRTIPQTTADPAAASFTLGFPPQTFTDEGAGGTPPDGRDFNGLFFYLSGWVRWLMAGGPVPYDATFQTAIGGYPRGAIVRSPSNPAIEYRSTVDNNTTDPTTGGAGWMRPFTRGVSLPSNIQYRTWPAGDGNIMIRMSGDTDFNTETTNLITYPFPMGALTDYGVSTVEIADTDVADQVAQVAGVSNLEIRIKMQAIAGGSYTWPIRARWWAEGVL